MDKSTVYKGEEEAVVHNVIYNRNEEGKRFIKIALRKLRPIAIGDKFCLMPNAEVMTKSGWVTLEKLCVISKLKEKTLPAICTLNPTTHAIEYHVPSTINSFDHNGDMYSLKSRFINCVSTLNHKMYTREKRGEYALDEVQNIMNIKKYWLRHGKNTQPDIDTFTIPVYKQYQQRNISMDIWLDLLGIYIAGGYVYGDEESYVLIIKCYYPQRAEHTERINNIIQYLDSLGNNFIYGYNKTKDTEVLLLDSQMANALVQTTNYSNKILPEYIFNLGKRQSKILLNSICDTYADKNGSSWMIMVKSIILASHIHILSINCGWNANITNINMNTDEYNFIRIYIHKSKISLEPLVGGKKTIEEIIQYTGKVMCPTVENNIFMVRCNNTTYWTSNSSRAGLVILAWGSW
jgi:hypothetical protein